MTPTTKTNRDGSENGLPPTRRKSERKRPVKSERRLKSRRKIGLSINGHGRHEFVLCEYALSYPKCKTRFGYEFVRFRYSHQVHRSLPPPLVDRWVTTSNRIPR